MRSEAFLNSFALNLSRVFHPFIVSVPAAIVYLYIADLTLIDSLKWISISTSLTIVPTALFMKFHPKYHIRDINSRESRNLLYVIGLMELVFLTGILWILKAPGLIRLLTYSIVLLTVVGASINRVTKISLHVGVLSGFSAAFTFISLPLGLIGFLITVGVGWSRLRLERHTPQQVILGLIIPASCMFLVFQTLI